MLVVVEQGAHLSSTQFIWVFNRSYHNFFLRKLFFASYCLWVCFCCHSGICAQHRDKDGRGNGPKAIANGSTRRSQLSGLHSHTRHGREQSAKSWGKELIVKCCFRGRGKQSRKNVCSRGARRPQRSCAAIDESDSASSIRVAFTAVCTWIYDVAIRVI